jgi:hypothetical protein
MTSDTEELYGPAGTNKGYTHTLCCAVFLTHPHILQSSVLLLFCKIRWIQKEKTKR